MVDSGGSSDLSAVPADIQELGKYAFDLADILRSALGSASREVDAVTSSSWLGTASDAFAAGWNETQDGGNKIADALEQMARSLGITAQSYGVHDNQFAAQISTLDLP